MRPKRFPPLHLTIIFCILGIGLSNAEPKRINGIAAKVNGRVVTLNEVNYLLTPIYAQLRAQYPRRGEEFNSKMEEARAKILSEIIDREIIIDEYKQLGATIPDAAIESDVKRHINQLYNGDKEKFAEELSKSRLTMNRFYEISKERMIVQAMRQSQFDDAAPPLPNEIRDEYEASKNDLRDISKDTITFNKIFIPIKNMKDPGTSAEIQLALAEDLVKDIKDGKDIAELAKIHSKDAFAEAGGLQEDVPRIDLYPEFAAIIFDAKEGDVIGPLADETGYTIVKPIKINLGPVPSLGEVREIIEQRVKRKKTSAQYEAWIEMRRKRAMIEICN